MSSPALTHVRLLRLSISGGVLRELISSFFFSAITSISSRFSILLTSTPLSFWSLSNGSTTSLKRRFPEMFRLGLHPNREPMVAILSHFTALILRAPRQWFNHFLEETVP